MTRTSASRALIASLALVAGAPAAAQDRPVPYWASIAAGEATMRTGPDRSYPATWIYRRRDLPVKVMQVHDAWRRVQEQDGTTGWMLAVLLAARRTGIVTGGYQPIRDKPEDSARLLWQAQAGVVARVQKCDGRWCRVEIGARKGWMPQAGLWGIDPGERIE
jgi:SH3-like domain-containing protein